MITQQTSTAIRGTILLVDDSAYARRRIRRFLSDLGTWNVIEASDSEEAETLFAKHRPTIVLLDQVMRGRSGVETAARLRAISTDVLIFLVTVVDDSELHWLAVRAGIRAVVEKNDWDGLRHALEEACRV